MNANRWMRHAGPVALTVLLTLLLASLGTGSAQAKAAGSSATVANHGFGVTMPGVPWDLGGLAALSGSLDRSPRQVMWYSAWSDRTAFPANAAGQVAATGAVPVVTWEPWDPQGGPDQPAYALDRIAAGDFKSYETTWAKQIKAYGGPVVLRFAHEMNGSWYPWSAQANGNTASDYVAAWRHLRSVFSAQKVTNVSWSWSPNVPYVGSTPLSSLYPGDAYVDQVALDGYNWGATQPWSTWTSFWDLFSPGVAELRSLTDKPLMVGEVGSAERGGDKAAWVRDMFAALAQHPEVRGFTWFDFAKETDWRIDSTPGSLDAFRAGLATYGS
jgi:hypothetical protein